MARLAEGGYALSGVNAFMMPVRASSQARKAAERELANPRGVHLLKGERARSQALVCLARYKCCRASSGRDGRPGRSGGTKQASDNGRPHMHDELRPGVDRLQRGQYVLVLIAGASSSIGDAKIGDARGIKDLFTRRYDAFRKPKPDSARSCELRPADRSPILARQRR